jgi:hypothetical protein
MVVSKKHLDSYRSLLTTSSVTRHRKHDCNNYDELYRDNAIARTIVNLVIDKSLLGLETNDYNLKLIRTILVHSRVNGSVICLRNNSNQILLSDDELCTLNLEEKVAKLNDELYYDYYHIEDGVLRRTRDDIDRYESAKESIAIALKENHIFVIGVKGLSALNSLDGEFSSLYQQRLQSISDSKENHSGVALDSELEQISFESKDLSNLKDLFEIAERSIIASSGLPKSVIFGSSESSALSSAGDSDSQAFLDLVLSYRRQVVVPLAKWLQIDFDVHYESFLELDLKEVQEAKLLESNRIVTLFNAGLISQKTAQELLFLPVEEVVSPETKKATSNPVVGNNFPSDLVAKEV